MKKQVLAGALAASIAAVAIAGGTLAYFTAEDSAKNDFTIGNVKIEVTEPSWDGLVEGADNESINMYPGEAVAKDPYVTNLGENPAFVRVKITMPADVDVAYEAANDYAGSFSINEGWTVGENGWIYYTKVLQPGETTATPVFDRIRLSEDETNGNPDEILSINVDAEAIQAQGAAAQWDRVLKMNAKEIADWFETHEQLPYEPDLA